jgi:hypothetical protein
MATITLARKGNLRTTHFLSQKSLLSALLMAEFESHLDRQYRKAKKAPHADFISL